MEPNTHHTNTNDLHNHDLPNTQSLNGAALAYPVSNHFPSGDQYNSFYNSPPQVAFANAWGQPTLVGPNAYMPQSGTWSQGQHLARNSYGQEYNPIPPIPNPFQYGGSFDNHQFQNYSNPTFDEPLPYNNEGLLGQGNFQTSATTAFVDANSPLQQGATVAPSVLQSYPSTYGSIDSRMETQTPPQQKSSSLLVSGTTKKATQSAKPHLDLMSRNFVKKIPAGKRKGRISTIDANELMKSIKSEKLMDFIYVASEEQSSEEPRVIYPNVVARKSIKELRAQILQRQGGRPWHTEQAAMRKKMKLKDALASRFKSAVSSSNGLLQSGTPPTAASPSDSSSEEESDDEESDDEDEEPSPLPSSRPSDKVKAIEYDIVKAVWFRRNTTLGAAAIREALGDFWNVVKGLRDSWKALTLELQAAEKDKNASKVDKLKGLVTEQRQILEKVLDLTVKHGHKDVVERFGEITTLMAFFQSLIADRVKENAYDSPLIGHILKLLVGCTTVDRALLEKTKLDKILARLLKKGSEQVKSLAQQVLDNTSKATKQKTGDGKDSQVKDSVKRTTTQPLKADSADLKRPRVADSASSLVPKRATAGAPAKLSGPTSKPGPSSAKLPNTKSAPLAKGDAKQGSAATAVPTTKVKHIVPKPSSLLSSLQSASKKPGTSIAAQKATLASDTAKLKTAESKPVAIVAAAPKAAFSFSQTLADLGKPKVVETTKQAVNDGPPETEEEKKKRLRKEERRKLRVVFKPGASLEEIRLFHHDPEEELGHDDNMIRDVADVNNEGRMLKMHRERDDDEDDEEEAENPEVEELMPWKPPTPIDFSDTDYEVTVQNHTTRGGGTVEVNSPEKAVQEQRERRTLVQIYTEMNPIPPSPREPVDQYSGPEKPPVSFGEPSAAVRLREREFYAQTQMQTRPAMNPAPAITPSIAQLLARLAAPQQQASAAQQYQQAPENQQFQQAPAVQQYQPPPAVSTSAAPKTDLEAIFARFATKNINSAPVQRPDIDPSFHNALAIFKQQQTQQPAQQPTPQPQVLAQGHAQPQLQAQFSAPPTTADLTALLARFGQQASMSSQNNDQAQMQDYQNQSQNLTASSNGNGNDRKRQWGPDDSYDDAKRAKGNDPKKAWNENGDHKKPWNGIPSVRCRFWMEGNCKKGKECTFRHE